MSKIFRIKPQAATQQLIEKFEEGVLIRYKILFWKRDGLKIQKLLSDTRYPTRGQS